MYTFIIIFNKVIIYKKLLNGQKDSLIVNDLWIHVTARIAQRSMLTRGSKMYRLGNGSMSSAETYHDSMSGSRHVDPHTHFVHFFKE